jgi:hypothetical protein
VGLTFEHEQSCTKFHQCTPAGDLIFDCPEGTFFNKETKVCDCGGAKECDGVSYAECPLTVETDVCLGKNIGEQMGHENSCEAFYQCSPHGASLFACPEGKSFNMATKTCDLTENAKCKKSRGCCRPQRNTGCCNRGPPRCKPCGGWMVQKVCCIKCVQCNPCWSCGGGGGNGTGN